MASSKERSPARGGVELRGIDRAGKADRREPKAEIAKLQEPNGLPALWINIGRECIGRLYSGPSGFGAFSDAGIFLGVFTTMPAARASICDHHRAVVEVQVVEAEHHIVEREHHVVERRRAA